MLIPKAVAFLTGATADKKDRRGRFEHIYIKPGLAMATDTYMLVQLTFNGENCQDYPLFNGVEEILDDYQPFLIHKDLVKSLEQSRDKKQSALPSVRDTLGAVIEQSENKTSIYNTDLSSHNTVLARQDHEFPPIKIEDYRPRVGSARVIVNAGLLHKMTTVLHNMQKKKPLKLTMTIDDQKHIIHFTATTETGEQVEAFMLTIKTKD